AIVGIGALANDALARHSGLPCWDAPAGGVLVDKFCRTADASIHAIGDVAAFELRGQTTRLESVQNACDQARALAQTLMGTRTAYAPVPWFWSDQYDKKLQMVGLHAGADRSVFRPGKRDGTGSVWYFRAGDLIAVEAVSDPRAYMTGKAYLEKGIAISAEQILNEDRHATATA
ncbi:MAG: FAD-dependent oxidoreductase, partial [Alphaproteobacteria bacterium]|nr:FAD-dependent oxidoreductase [Alphaproteobacteria bacterium]